VDDLGRVPKFGFGDGDLYDNYTIAVADRIVELGYWVG